MKQTQVKLSQDKSTFWAESDEFIESVLTECPYCGREGCDCAPMDEDYEFFGTT